MLNALDLGFGGDAQAALFKIIGPIGADLVKDWITFQSRMRFDAYVQVFPKKLEQLLSLMVATGGT